MPSLALRVDDKPQAVHNDGRRVSPLSSHCDKMKAKTHLGRGRRRLVLATPFGARVCEQSRDGLSRQSRQIKSNN